MPCSPRLYIVLLTLFGVLFGAKAADLRVATLNVRQGVGPSRDASNVAAREVLQRIDADVVALQEIHRDDLVGSPNFLQQFASHLGYQHIHVAGGDRVLDQHTRVVFLSRHPFATTTNILPPSGALDMTRQIPAVVVDLPEVEDDPLLLSVHLKCCGDFDDYFRRAIELHRVATWFEAEKARSSDPVILLGDFNLIPGTRSYHTAPPGLPALFDLGSDIPFPVSYTTDAPSYFPNLSFTALPCRQLNGNPFTTGTSALDLILASDALTDRPHASEIYNSVLDTSNNQGLPKHGSPLAPSTSAEASDHHAVFADFTLPDTARLELHSSNLTIGENGESVPVTLSLSPPPTAPITLQFTTSDPGELLPEKNSIQLPPGTATHTFAVRPQSDELLDGDQPVTLTVAADGYTSTALALTIQDQSRVEYSFARSGQALHESFDRYDGSAPPAGWQLSPPLFLGPDEGDASLPGFYAYGSPDDPSLGILLNGEGAWATASYRNNSDRTLTALSICFDAEQWRSSQGGRTDTLKVILRTSDGELLLSDLAFETTTTLPNGPIPGGTSHSLRTEISHLNIAPGEAFQLSFLAQPGPPAVSSPLDGIFFNEFHYDNRDADELEFIEVTLGPDFTESLSTVSVVLYNGNGGKVYGTHNLSTFTQGETTDSGHRLFAKFIPNLQNGSPDAMALVVDGVVSQFLSYEGTFLANDGPARGLTSTDIGVAQQDPTPLSGSGSLGLIGAGGDSTDFTWTRIESAYSPGKTNPGQTLLLASGAQGIAVDSLIVTFLPDTDLDGVPDRTDSDDDNDGLTDEEELALGTDPGSDDTDQDGVTDAEEDLDQDGSSNLAELRVTLTDPQDPKSRFGFRFLDQTHIEVPTLTERRYHLERSGDLKSWATVARWSGDGSPRIVDLFTNSRSQFYRVSVELAP